VARSSFQGRARGIPGSIPRGNNAWPVRMPLCTSWISRPPLMGRNRCESKKNKKNKVKSNLTVKKLLYIHVSRSYRTTYKFPNSLEPILYNFLFQRNWEYNRIIVLLCHHFNDQHIINTKTKQTINRGKWK
jgi:hypothetical protein